MQFMKPCASGLYNAWWITIADGAYPHNPAAYPEYGLSTYNIFRDGSGICHASCKKGRFNLRPGYITFGAAGCSGLRHFQADSHLIAWLHNQNIDYDIITDDELDREGVEVIKELRCLDDWHPPRIPYYCNVGCPDWPIAMEAGD